MRRGVFCQASSNQRVRETFFDGSKPLIIRCCQSDSSAGPFNRKINSAPSRRAVWRHTLRSFKALVGTSYAGPKPSPDGGAGSKRFARKHVPATFRSRSKSVLRNFGQMVLTTVRKETSLRSSSTTERACYHAIYNPTKKKCLQHLLTRKRFLYFCSRNGFIRVQL